jgi:ketosteroid isomerase-like protein
MGASNVEKIRETLAIFNREGGAAALDYAMGGGTELVWHSAPEWPGKPLYEGREGALELMAEWTESFEDYRWDLEHAYDLGDRVLALVHHRGSTLGGRFEGQVAAIWRLEDGNVVETWFFFSWDQARAAAGLEQRITP